MRVASGEVNGFVAKLDRAMIKVFDADLFAVEDRRRMVSRSTVKPQTMSVHVLETDLRPLGVKYILNPSRLGVQQ